MNYDPADRSADERALLESFLDVQRRRVVDRVEGQGNDVVFRQVLPATSMTIAGIVSCE